MLKRLIKRTQLDVHIFEKTNGVEALEFFQEYDNYSEQYRDDYPPLLCFLDINMPLMDGWEFLSHFNELRSKKELQSMAVMMFSSSTDARDRDRARDYDFITAYLVKGDVNAEQLKEKIISSHSSHDKRAVPSEPRSTVPSESQ